MAESRPGLVFEATFDAGPGIAGTGFSYEGTTPVISPIVTYDRGALDGQGVRRGPVGLSWNGSLVVRAPAAHF
ncbi:MAG TPA: hypothetical protein VGE72_25085 [Azospirillum sp.]